MSEKEQIKKGGLAGKMAGYTPEPPESVWDGISKELNGGGSKRNLFVILAVAAGLALAVSVGIRLFNDNSLISVPETISERNVTQDENNKDILTGTAHSDSDKDVDEVAILNSDRQEKTFRPLLKDSIRRKKPGLKEKVLIALEEESNDNSKKTVSIAAVINEYEDKTDTINDIPSEITEAEVKINEDSLLKLLVPEMSEIEEEVKESKAKKWQLGAGLAPQYSYRDVASPNVGENLKVNKSESAKITYSGGVNLAYNASKRLAIESGIYYNKMGVNIGDYNNFRDKSNLEYGSTEDYSNRIVSISNSMGTAVSKDKAQFINTYSRTDALSNFQSLSPEILLLDNSVVSSFSQTFEFLEIPLSVKYNLIDRSLKVQIIGGVSTNLLMNNRLFASTSAGDEEIGEFQNLNSFNYSGNAGLGFVYSFATSFSISVEPRFRYYLNSINNDLLPPTRPYTFGLMTGLNYLF